MDHAANDRTQVDSILPDLADAPLTALADGADEALARASDLTRHRIAPAGVACASFNSALGDDGPADRFRRHPRRPPRE